MPGASPQPLRIYYEDHLVAVVAHFARVGKRVMPLGADWGLTEGMLVQLSFDCGATRQGGVVERSDERLTIRIEQQRLSPSRPG